MATKVASPKSSPRSKGAGKPPEANPDLSRFDQFGEDDISRDLEAIYASDRQAFRRLVWAAIEAEIKLTGPGGVSSPIWSTLTELAGEDYGPGVEKAYQQIRREAGLSPEPESSDEVDSWDSIYERPIVDMESKIAEWVGDDPNRLRELYNVVLADDYYNDELIAAAAKGNKPVRAMAEAICQSAWDCFQGEIFRRAEDNLKREAERKAVTE